MTTNCSRKARTLKSKIAALKDAIDDVAPGILMGGSQADYDAGFNALKSHVEDCIAVLEDQLAEEIAKDGAR